MLGSTSKVCYKHCEGRVKMCVRCIRTMDHQVCCFKEFSYSFPGTLFNLGCLIRCAVVVKAVGWYLRVF